MKKKPSSPETHGANNSKAAKKVTIGLRNTMMHVR